MLYFAYGSNMATARLQRRLSCAERVGVAVLPGYQLRFQVASTKDGSGKCDAHFTGSNVDQVLGVLFRLDPRAREILDAYEGVGVEYRAADVTVNQSPGGEVRALIYLGINLNPGLRPYPWYLEHVLRGALENELPTDYIAAIRTVATIDDPDPARVVRELSIYCLD